MYDLIGWLDEQKSCTSLIFKLDIFGHDIYEHLVLIIHLTPALVFLGKTIHNVNTTFEITLTFTIV